MTLFSPVLLATAAAAASGVAIDGAEDLVLAHDDECAVAATEGGEMPQGGCALGAFQLRATRKALDAAQEAEKKARFCFWPFPCPSNDDQEAEKKTEVPDDDGDNDEEAEKKAKVPDDDGDDDQEAEKKAKVKVPDDDGGDDQEAEKKATVPDEDGGDDQEAEKKKAKVLADDDDEDDDDDDDDDDYQDDKDDEDEDQQKDEAPSGPKMDPLPEEKPIPRMKKTRVTSPVVIKGNMMYDSKSGARFFSKGVAYNPRNSVFDIQQMQDGKCTPGRPAEAKMQYADDPTADEHEATWKEALNAMAYAGANTVRLYNIDPEQDHQKFMDYAASLGIYVIIPLTRHDWGFLPAGMPSPACYTEEIDGYGNVGTNLLTSAKLIVKEFSQYDNTLLFTVANEITVYHTNGFAAFPCVKAFARDIHRYQAQCKEGMRRVPLIYSDMDMGRDREVVGRYLACELESEDDAVDAYGLNIYSWCDKEYLDDKGKPNFKHSPYSPIAEQFKSLSIPLVFTEFGCTFGEYKTSCPYKGGRTWDDVPTFFNEFKEILSGAVAFEFSMEENQYGIALTPGFTSAENNDGKMYYLDAYYALRKQFKKHSMDSKWDGADIGDCKWTPASVVTMEHSHHRAECPKLEEVKKLFEVRALTVDPNWGELPPTPEGADQDGLEKCPEYSVAPVLKEEGCCHYEC